MKKLIKALQILSKYCKREYPTNCEHDLLYVDVDPKLVSKEDIDKLAVLDFFPGTDDWTSSGFISFKYGSCWMDSYNKINIPEISLVNLPAYKQKLSINKKIMKFIKNIFNKLKRMI